MDICQLVYATVPSRLSVNIMSSELVMNDEYSACCLLYRRLDVFWCSTIEYTPVMY